MRVERADWSLLGFLGICWVGKRGDGGVSCQVSWPEEGVGNKEMSGTRVEGLVNKEMSGTRVECEESWSWRGGSLERC